MNNLESKDKKISELEAKVNELEQTLACEINRLRQAAGAWRRKAEEKGAKRTSIQEGYNADTGMHYKVVVLTEVPPDLEIKLVLEFIKATILPQVYPYTFRRIDYSSRYKGWLMEIERPLNVNMQIEDVFLNNYYG